MGHAHRTRGVGRPVLLQHAFKHHKEWLKNWAPLCVHTMVGNVKSLSICLMEYSAAIKDNYDNFIKHENCLW